MLAAGLFGAGTAMAMGDGYSYHYDSGTTYHYYSSPGTTYYYESYTYTPRGTFGYYDNPYNPYWSYRGPLGQGSGHDMRVGR